jgi:hypothetical protein
VLPLPSQAWCRPPVSQSGRSGFLHSTHHQSRLRAPLRRLRRGSGRKPDQPNEMATALSLCFFFFLVSICVEAVDFTTSADLECRAACMHRLQGAGFAHTHSSRTRSLLALSTRRQPLASGHDRPPCACNHHPGG